MPLKQNTFLILPNAPPNNFTHGAPPPPESLSRQPLMTSKQARKSYNERTRGQKRSRAEQREWERAEQERIRKELEKEQNAVRARAARERKKAKDQAVLDQKKKRGLPLVSVRPSQDTIARFVRKGGSKRERDPDPEPLASRDSKPVEDEEGSDAIINTKSLSGNQKRARLNIILEQDDVTVHIDPVSISPNISFIPAPPPQAPRLDTQSFRSLMSQGDAQGNTAHPLIISVSSKRLSQASGNLNDHARMSEPVVDITPLDGTDIVTAMKTPLDKDRIVSKHRELLPCNSQFSAIDKASLTKPLAFDQAGKAVEQSSHQAEHAGTTDTTTTIDTGLPSDPSLSVFPVHGKPRRAKLRFTTAWNSVHRVSTSLPAPSLDQKSTAPPSLSSARKPLEQIPQDVAMMQAPALSKAQHSVPSPVTKAMTIPCQQLQAQPEPMPPSNTQSFLETYFLDILPTPSQEERELFGDENTKPGLMGPPPKPALPMPVVNTRPRSFQNHATHKVPAARDCSLKYSRPKFATPAVPRWTHGHGSQTRERQPNVRPQFHACRLSNRPAPVAKVQQPPVADLGFLSTQDVMLSTQDVLEVEEPAIRIPEKAFHARRPRFLRQQASAKADTSPVPRSLNPKLANPASSSLKSKDAPPTKPSAVSYQHKASQMCRNSKVSIEALFDSQDNKISAGKTIRPRNPQSTPVARSQESTNALGISHKKGQAQTLGERPAPPQSAQQENLSPVLLAGADDKAPGPTDGSTDSEAPDSQGRPRYFMSSCTNIRIGLASLESMRTFEVEQRKREEQSRKREARRALHAKEKQHAMEPKRRAYETLQAASTGDCGIAEEGVHRDAHTRSLGSTGMVEQQAELDQFASDLIFTLSQEENEMRGSSAPLDGQTLRGLPLASKTLVGSTQETDYGDLDISESLAILEAENL